MRRTDALTRRTPMPKCTTGLRRRVALKKRNHKRRDPAKAVAQREAVLARDGGCAFEVSVAGRWIRCGSTAELQTCHVVRRNLCGDAIYDAAVAITGCRAHHDIADHRTHPSTWGYVRFPEVAIARAVAAIKKVETERAAAGRAVVRLKAS